MYGNELTLCIVNFVFLELYRWFLPSFPIPWGRIPEHPYPHYFWKKGLCKAAEREDMRSKSTRNSGCRHYYRISPHHIFMRLAQTVKESFCIFRSKIDSETGEVLVDLPPRKDMDFLLSFTPAERMIYQFVKRHPLQILAKLTRLRQGMLISETRSSG